MSTTKLSQIIPAAPALTDQVVGVKGGTTDALFSLSQVQQTVGQFVNVMSFGAVGDGVTDDTVAIQACLDASPGQVILFPANHTFLISSSLFPNSGQTIWGYGATIKCVPQGWYLFTFVTVRGVSVQLYGFFVLVNCTDVSFLGLHWYGTHTATNAGDFRASHTPKFIGLTYTTTIPFTERIRIEDNFFEHKDYEGIFPQDFTLNVRWIIKNNFFSDIGFQPGATFPYLPTIQGDISDSVIDGNILMNCGSSISMSGVNNVVTNNIILSPQGTGAIFLNGDGPSNRQSVCANNFIQFSLNNGVGCTVGISINSAGSGNEPAPLLVANNIIEFTSSVPGTDFATAIEGFSTAEVKISGNLIDGSGNGFLGGILMFGPATSSGYVPSYFIDSNLVFFKNNTGAGQNQTGIQVSPNGGHIQAYVSNNKVLGTHQNAYYFSNLSGGGTTDVFVYDNNFKDGGFVTGPTNATLATDSQNNGRAYSYSATQKITAYFDELSTAFLPTTTVAGLPGSPSPGAMAYVSDGVAGATWGSTVAGSSSTNYLLWFNNSNWTVVGK